MCNFVFLCTQTINSCKILEQFQHFLTMHREYNNDMKYKARVLRLGIKHVMKAGHRTIGEMFTIVRFPLVITA